MAVSAALGWEGDELEATLRNDGDEPVRFSTAFLLPSIAFEVVDAAGARVPAGPPPVPPEDPGATMAELAPGHSLSIFYARSELPAGARVRFVGVAPEVPGAWSGTITSDWIDFR